MEHSILGENEIHKLQKSYKDVVDKCDDVVHGSSITFSGNAASVRLWSILPLKVFYMS